MTDEIAVDFSVQFKTHLFHCAIMENDVSRGLYANLFSVIAPTLFLLLTFHC